MLSLQSLPTKVDCELFDLDPVCQISADLVSTRRFLLGFGRALSRGGTEVDKEEKEEVAVADLKGSAKRLLSALEGARKDDALLKAVPSGKKEEGDAARGGEWIWRREAVAHLEGVDLMARRVLGALEAMEGKRVRDKFFDCSNKKM